MSTFGRWRNRYLDPDLFNYNCNSFPTSLHKFVGVKVFLCLTGMFSSLCSSRRKLHNHSFFQVTGILRKCGRAVSLMHTQWSYFLLLLIWKAFICRYSQVSFPTWKSEKQTCVLEMGLWLCFANKAWLTFMESPTMPFFFLPSWVKISQNIRGFDYIFWKDFHNYSTHA